MLRPAALRHDDDIEPQRIGLIAWMPADESRGCTGDTLTLIGRHRFYGMIDGVAGFHLDEGKHAAPPGDQVDLAHGYAEVPRQDAITLQPQQQHGPELAAAAAAIGALPALAMAFAR